MRVYRFDDLSAVIMAVVLLCLLMGASAPAQPSGPSPGLSPTEVVRAQLAALRSHDLQAGSEQAFRFASPAARQAIGTSHDFETMLKQQYADMLTQTHASVELRTQHGDQAEVVAHLQQVTGQRSAYVFELSRQHGGDCDGCWKTDGVIALQPQNNEPLYSI